MSNDSNSSPLPGNPGDADAAVTQALPQATLTMSLGLHGDPIHRIPEVIGHYRIIRLLGEGGMGAVYEAEQETPRRTVALKIIKPGHGSAGLLLRFEKEAQAPGCLQHPGIAQIYEAGGKGLSAAKPTAWRFYRGTFAGPAGAIEVGRTARRRRPRMTSLSDGHSVQVTFRQVSRVEHFSPVRAADYELRRLKIPGAPTAFWLKSHIEGKDLVVPIAGKLHGLKYLKAYPAEKFLAALRPIALARQQKNNEPRK